MARMLQALKNLEARSSPRPGPLPAAVASAPAADEETLTAAIERAVASADPAISVATQIEFAAAAIADLSVVVGEKVFGAAEAGGTCEIAAGAVTALERSTVAEGTLVSEPDTCEPTGFRTAGRPGALLPPLDIATPPLVTAPVGYRSTAFEKSALRVLTDPIRARPLVELAERLDADIKQTCSRTLLLAGVGTADDVHTTLLYTGILMTERQPGDVLLVDADWKSGVFSTALERDRQRGLGELVEESASIAEVCLPTATGRLFFLPAGQRRQTDLSTAGGRLEVALKKLAERFALVLIDGGNSEDLGCTALVRQADATYLVVRLGAVEAVAAQAALRDLRASGARVLGAIAT